MLSSPLPLLPLFSVFSLLFFVSSSSSSSLFHFSSCFVSYSNTFSDLRGEETKLKLLTTLWHTQLTAIQKPKENKSTVLPGVWLIDQDLLAGMAQDDCQQIVGGICASAMACAAYSIM